MSAALRLTKLFCVLFLYSKWLILLYKDWNDIFFLQASWHHLFVAGTWSRCHTGRWGPVDSAPFCCSERRWQGRPPPAWQRSSGGCPGKSRLDAPPPGLPERPRNSGAPAAFQAVRGSSRRTGGAREDATPPSLRLRTSEYCQAPPLSGSRSQRCRLLSLHSSSLISWGRP